MVQKTWGWLEFVWYSPLGALTPRGAVLMFVARIPVLVAVGRFVSSSNGMA
jgi:hypothetical protein